MGTPYPLEKKNQILGRILSKEITVEQAHREYSRGCKFFLCPGDNCAPVGRERNHRGTPYTLHDSASR